MITVGGKNEILLKKVGALKKKRMKEGEVHRHGSGHVIWRVIRLHDYIKGP